MNRSGDQRLVLAGWEPSQRAKRLGGEHPSLGSLLCRWRDEIDGPELARRQCALRRLHRGVAKDLVQPAP
jgi:hypothetical protein